MTATLEALRGRLGQTSQLDSVAALTQQATDNLVALNGAVAEMLQLRMARESKLEEISRIHKEILGDNVTLIDDVYYEIILQSDALAPMGSSGVVDMVDRGWNAEMAGL